MSNTGVVGNIVDCWTIAGAIILSALIVEVLEPPSGNTSWLLIAIFSSQVTYIVYYKYQQIDVQ